MRREGCSSRCPTSRRECYCHRRQGLTDPTEQLRYVWEILCEPLLLFGQFHGFTYLLNGQFQGICLKESQPKERTFAGRAAPLERTFGRVKAPSKPTFTLILRDLTKHPAPQARMQVFRLVLRCAPSFPVFLFPVPCSLFSPPHGDAGEGQYGQSAHWLAEEAGRRKAAEQQQILDLRPGRSIRRSRDNAVVVHLARIVNADLDHHRTI